MRTAQHQTEQIPRVFWEPSVQRVTQDQFSKFLRTMGQMHPFTLPLPIGWFLRTIGQRHPYTLPLPIGWFLRTTQDQTKPVL